MTTTEWHGDRCFCDHVRRHYSQCLFERCLGVRRPRRSVYEGDGLADDLAAPDDPVQRVLEGAWNSMRILRAGNQHGVGGADLAPELCDHLRRLIAVDVRVEQRQFSELRVEQNLDAFRCEIGGSKNQGRVRREAAQASGYRKNSKHRTVRCPMPPIRFRT